ncbi:hypothetical protein [Mangrovicoccus ximenensis]|uniref:hypothetical protein n=1 Tax=Mangrovicoccus ximenensis TaxID=1911570 RepID=UPI0011AE8877|nr:hypothetical protein [Mangrovicoccus ximenensis]
MSRLIHLCRCTVLAVMLGALAALAIALGLGAGLIGAGTARWTLLAALPCGFALSFIALRLCPP